MSQPGTNILDVLRSTLNTNVVGDILDQHGYWHQFLPAEIRSIGGPAVVVGRAMPVLIGDVYEPPKKPFGLMTEALDNLEQDEIYITGGGLMRSAYWGEILTATSRKRGAAGAVINGYHRDTAGILAQNWPVFSRGAFAQDSSVRTVVLDFRCKIEIEGVVIAPGDIVFGDVDGVLVIPQDVAADVIEAATIKASGEKTVLRDIENGMSSTEAFARHGIL